MAGYSVFHDLTSTLQQQLFHALDSAVDVDFDVTDATTDIQAQTPQQAADSKGGSSGKVSLYLYHMDINAHLRNQPLVNIGSDALMKPPLPFRAKYLVTPVSDDHLTNQLMLGRVIQYLYDNPVLKSSETLVLEDNKGGATELRIHPDNLSIESLNQIWTAMSEPYRLSYSFSVDVITIDSAQAPRAARRVGV